VLLATAAGDDAGPAAAQPWEGATVLRRLLDQLASLGVEDLQVVTRPGWEDDLALDGSVRVHTSATPADDLRTIAEIARTGSGSLVVAHGDVVTHREALAGLLADPRLPTAILQAATGVAGRFAQRVRTRRGRVVSAASPYHSTHRPTGAFLGVLKVAPADRPTLAGVAERMAELVTPEPPPAWSAELERKAGSWRTSLAMLAARQAGLEAPETLDLPPADEAELSRRLGAVPHDVASLLLTGLVRSGVHVGSSHLRKLFWARPLSREAVDRAAEEITEYDEDRVLLDSAVKSNDGFFTTFFVSPYSKYIARWAARAGLTPNQVTTASVLIGVLAGAAFATGERWGLVAGAVLVQLSFTTDCVDGQLARYTRTFSKLGAWLDSIFDRTKEYVVFAGLAIGASRSGDPVWLLAACALTLQTVRHMSDFAFGAAQQHAIGAASQPPIEQPSDRLGAGNALEVEEPDLEAGRPEAEPEAPEPEPEPRQPLPRRALSLWHRFDRLPIVVWPKKMIAFPIGERFAAISVTAALFTPRTTFVVLLAWGGVAAAYTLTGRVLRSIA
jgi:hypothetical protein